MELRQNIRCRIFFPAVSQTSHGCTILILTIIIIFVADKEEILTRDLTFSATSARNLDMWWHNVGTEPESDNWIKWIEKCRK